MERGIETIPQHLFGFYYLVTPLAASHIYGLERTITAVDGDHDILFQWFRLDQLHTITLYPIFLPTALRTLPTNPQHITLIDEDVQQWRNAHRA